RWRRGCTLRLELHGKGAARFPGIDVRCGQLVHDLRHKNPQRGHVDEERQDERDPNEWYREDVVPIAPVVAPIVHREWYRLLHCYNVDARTAVRVPRC